MLTDKIQLNGPNTSTTGTFCEVTSQAWVQVYPSYLLLDHVLILNYIYITTVLRQQLEDQLEDEKIFNGLFVIIQQHLQHLNPKQS